MDEANAATSDDIHHVNETVIALRDSLQTFSDDLASLGAYVTEIDERLRKVEGMAKFCYAICNNAEIKRIADEAAPSARGRWAAAAPRVQFGGQGGPSGRVFVPSPGGYVAPKRDSN